MLSNEIQKAVYTALKASSGLSALIVDVYDNVPKPALASDDSAFPFVMIGEDDFTAWDTNCTLGFEGSLQVRTYARSGGGKKLIKQIEGEIYNALNRADLVIENATLTTINYTNSNYATEPDGLTQVAITNFEILVDKNA